MIYVLQAVLKMVTKITHENAKRMTQEVNNFCLVNVDAGADKWEVCDFM